MTFTNDKSTLTVQQIGRRQSLTPEGFLLCEDVPIARTGEMYYGPGEVPVDPGSDGIVRITRDAGELFSADTIASFNGKPVTNDHPDDGVTPANWKSLTIGIVQNARQGDGIENDLIMADLLITDAEGIREVQSGKREVSCGYDAQYEQVSPGRGVQRRIIGNHVAIVDRGRCGPRCAIGDSAMATKPSLVDRLTAAFRKTLDEAKIDEDPDKKPEDDGAGDDDKKADKTADALSAIAATLKTLDARMSALEKAKDANGDDDEDDKGKKKTEDEDDEDAPGEPDKKATADSLKEVLSRAEILAPGVKIAVPTADSLKTRKQARDAICGCKRKALDAALKTDDGAKAVTPFLGGKTVDAASCATVDAAFVGASELLSQMRSGAFAGIVANIHTKDAAGKTAKATDSAALNQKHREFWAKHGGSSRF